MPQNLTRWFVMGVCATLFSGCQGRMTRTPEQTLLQQIQESHIEGNVPPVAEFIALLQRDLDAYFAELYGKKVAVAWEFLREGATQSGVANPKYYLWVTVKADGEYMNEGAIRVAAIGKTSFEVTDFLEIATIKNQQEDIYSVFPAPVCEKINGKIR